MTFEEMLEYPERLANLTDAQILEVIAPYFPITRPGDLSTAKAASDESDMDPGIAAKLAEIRAKRTTSGLAALLKKKS